MLFKRPKELLAKYDTTTTIFFPSESKKSMASGPITQEIQLNLIFEWILIRIINFYFVLKHLTEYMTLSDKNIRESNKQDHEELKESLLRLQK